MKKRGESSWIEVIRPISVMQNYQDEKCTGTIMHNNKYIWQNSVSWLRLVKRVKSSSTKLENCFFCLLEF
jgi:hypothetical protein